VDGYTAGPMPTMVGIREASPSLVYGAGLLIPFRVCPDRGFESLSLRKIPSQAPFCAVTIGRESGPVRWSQRSCQRYPGLGSSTFGRVRLRTPLRPEHACHGHRVRVARPTPRQACRRGGPEGHTRRMPRGPTSVAREVQDGSIAALVSLATAIQCTRSGWPSCLPAGMPIRDEGIAFTRVQAIRCRPRAAPSAAAAEASARRSGH
jgi:hypothetical protein